LRQGGQQSLHAVARRRHRSGHCYATTAARLPSPRGGAGPDRQVDGVLPDTGTVRC
jgi:hypothetical protein